MAALATEAPDAKSLQSWEDAFKYPIPAVRRMEQQLRADISGNRERLRTLVGTSYRDLLGTAENIIHMDKQMKNAEDYLGTISQKCNTRVLDETKASSQKILRSSKYDRVQEYSKASYLVILQRCPSALVDVLSTGGSLQSAAQILVLSRLLYKQVVDDSDDLLFAEGLRVRLGKLRSKLLTIVDRRLANPSQETTSTLHTMCAYALATNSSAADVLRHFHHVRLLAISQDTPGNESTQNQSLRSIQLWLSTMQDTQDLFPRKVSDALSQIKKKPLIQTEAIERIEALDLNIYESFIDDTIKNFTPYIRHDDLDVPTAASLLSTWSPLALQACVESLKKSLHGIEDFQTIVNLRREYIHMWVASKCRIVGITKSEGLDMLRGAFQEQLLHSIDVQISQHHSIVQAIRDTIKDEARSVPQYQGLWSRHLMDMDLVNGAQELFQGIHDQVHGTDRRHIAIMEIYTRWQNKSDTIRNSILELKARKWTIEELDDEAEDIEEIEDMKYRLEKEDPSQLEGEHQDALAAAMKNLKNGVEQVYQDIVAASTGSDKAVFMLRLLREIKQTSPDGWDSRDMVFSPVIDLQWLVAKSIVTELLPRHEQAISTATQGIKVPVRILWDGSPELPVIPSPWSFRLLRALHETMADIGQDIWTKSAVQQLQTIFNLELGAILQNTPNDSDELTTINSEDDHSEDTRDAKIQLYFDTMYLQAATGAQTEQKSAITMFSNDIIIKYKCSQEQATRMKTSAQDYWKRTSLLFALLS